MSREQEDREAMRYMAERDLQDAEDMRGAGWHSYLDTMPPDREALEWPAKIPDRPRGADTFRATVGEMLNRRPDVGVIGLYWRRTVPNNWSA